MGCTYMVSRQNVMWSPSAVETITAEKSRGGDGVRYTEDSAVLTNWRPHLSSNFLRRCNAHFCRPAMRTPRPPRDKFAM